MFTFAASLLAAVAVAQYDYSQSYYYEDEQPTVAEKFASMFEQNENGQWQIAGIPE